MDQLTVIFALVVPAAVSAAALWTTWRARAHIEHLASELHRVWETLERTKTLGTVTRLDALEGVVSGHIASNRQELGKLWAKVGGTGGNTRAPRVFDGETGEVDGEFDELLRFQRADPVRP